MLRLLLSLMFTLVAGLLPAWAEDVVHVRMETTMGTIDLALDRDKAPATVDNFLGYVESYYYDRMVIHRVVPGKLIQGGGYTKYYGERQTRDPVINEADNGLQNRRSTIAMARQVEPHSATSQWFINIADNPELDPEGKDRMLQWGYAVFGEVVAGMDVVDAIAAVPTGLVDRFEEAPLDQILVMKTYVIDAEDVGEQD